MKQTDTIPYTLDQVDLVAGTLKKLMSLCSIFTFTGSIGVGKTTLIRAVLRQCGVMGPISSPTFTYLNLYKNAQAEIFYHFDLYRIHSVDEFIHAGFNEYLYQPNSWAFIEWPEPVMGLIDHHACCITIEYNGEHKRILTYTIIDKG